MGLATPSEPWAMTAEQVKNRLTRGYGRNAKSELLLREHLEKFCRERWPEARIVHEIVMGEGRVRADVAAIGTDHIVAFEVKGEYDDTTRLLHQVGMYQLCVPEVWMVVAKAHHAEDARLIRHLIPSVGLLVGAGQSQRYHYDFNGLEHGLTVEAEAVPRPPVTRVMLEMCWRDELAWICGETRTSVGKKATRGSMIAALMDLPADQLQRQVCAALRGRDAIWRADEPIGPAAVRRPPTPERGAKVGPTTPARGDAKGGV